jgi:cell division protein FtsQ
MSAKIARGSQSRSRSRAKNQSRGSGKNAATAKMLDSLPMRAETIRRLSSWILVLMLVALALAVAAALRVPQMIGLAMGQAVGGAGFRVKQVDPRGLSRMDAMQVYQIAADQFDEPMPLVDLEGTRARLLRYGWVQDARVSRRWPDTLVVDIVERQPAAIWQHNQQLNLIDPNGVVLEQVKLDAMPDLPLVIGPGANRHSGELNQLLAAAPELKPILEGATWVGGRRWDLRFQSGEVLALPEGPAAAQKALVKFARMDKMTQLLGRGFARFDMRIPGKFIVRVSRTPGSTIPDLKAELPAGATPVDARKTI